MEPMRQRDQLRREFARLPLWRAERARLAALARHHPNDAQLLESQRNFLTALRGLELVRAFWQQGIYHDLEYIDIVGHLFCPDAIAKPDEWGVVS